MSCSLKSVYAGTATTPFVGVRRGCGNRESAKSMDSVGASAELRLPAGLYGFGSVYTQFFRGKLGTWQPAQPNFANSFSPFRIAACTAGSFGITRPGTAMAA